ncbi:hypothetical protein ACIQUQ_14675 [Streptomyces sp. NPDC101118]|uniref:hypothetical protein n=1 Tax=Streptomyces sp. NPDC101118 TaxID=3366109 RepID=UPI0037F8B116
MAKRYWRIWIPVAVLAAAAGGVVFVPEVVDEVRVERLLEVHTGDPAQVLKEAAERALAAGAAEVVVTAESPFYGDDGPAETGRMSWKSPHEALALPSMSRWRIDDDLYYHPAVPPGFDGSAESEWENGAAARVSAPAMLSALLVGGHPERVGPESVGGLPAMRYSVAVEPKPLDALLRKTFPCLTSPRPAPEPPRVPGSPDPRIHFDAWLDDHGQLVRVHRRSPRKTIEFRSFGGPAVTLPQGAEHVEDAVDGQPGCTVR